MSPQEKAKDLVEKMRDEIPCHCDDWEQAKQCALIVVDEALSEYVKGFNKMKQLHPYMLDAMQSDGYKYWQQVKQEIEKL